MQEARVRLTFGTCFLFVCLFGVVVVVVVLSSSSDCTFLFLAFVIIPYVQFKKKIPSRISIKT